SYRAIRFARRRAVGSTTLVCAVRLPFVGNLRLINPAKTLNTKNVIPGKRVFVRRGPSSEPVLGQVCNLHNARRATDAAHTVVHQGEISSRRRDRDGTRSTTPELAIPYNPIGS